MSSNNFFSLVKDEPRSPSELETRVVTMAPSNPMAIPGTPGGPSATPQGVATAVSQVGTPLQGPPMGSMTPGSLHPQALHRIDVDPNFEPVPRSRSNTWPLPCPEGYVEGDEGVGGMDPTAPTDHARTPGTPGGVPGDSGTGPPKKNTSRRNPWGNMSYADLIAQAIMSSPDGRATLSQIYDWMVQNVPYFKDKGDSNSSAGWKNSIRHNLSLHNRFMRVQNEGTGKSSWWVLNPDAKPGKSTRRRANTMEAGSFVKKRGRVKKKIGIDGVRNGLDPMSSPSSSISENQDLFPDSPLTHPGTGYSQLSPQDFRPRASSNASSCGRLSPIPFEPDMHDSQVPPMSPGLGGWHGEYYPYAHPAHAHTHDRHTDQLVDSIGEGLKIGTDSWGGSGHNPNPTDCMKLSQLSPHPPHLNGYVPGHPHHHHTQGYASYEDYHHRFASHGAAHGLPFSPHAHQDKMPPTPRPHHSNYSLSNLQAMSPAHSVHSLSPTQPLGEGQYPGPGGEADMRSTSSFPTPPASQPNAAHSHPPPTSEPNMLRAALTHREVGGGGGGGGGASQQQSGPPNQNNSGGPTSQNGPSNTGGAGGGGTGGGAGGSTGTGSATGGGGGAGGRGGSAGGGVPMHDLNDLSLDALPGELECNVEEVIKHELQMGGNLDFTFTQNNQAHAHHAHHAHTHPHTHAHNEAAAQMGAPPAVASYTSIAAGNQWVR